MTDQPARKPRTPVRLVIALLAATSLTGVSATFARAQQQPAAISPAAPARTVPDFADLVARVSPAVVSITTHMATTPASSEGIPTPFGLMIPQRPHVVEARGSGFIIDANGTVVTNNHVVKGGKTVSVTLSDGTELPAKVVGTDPRTDLAVLKVDAGHKLPFIELGNSAKVRPGEWVIAVGNPFGLGGTVTAGIVSALGRDIGSGPYDSFIQIDAPINQGNSGGPLFTQDGRVVGVNSAILSPTGGSVGIGFAIPSDMVRSVVADLEAHGHVTRGYLGVEAQPIRPAMARGLNLPKEDVGAGGALVASIEPNSPAAKAGLQPGDVIRSVEGQKISSPHDLAVDVAGMKPGTQAKVDVLRDGHDQTVTVALAELPNKNPASNNEQNMAREGVGVALTRLTPELRDQLDLPAHTNGAVVAEVKPGSPADQAGIQQGDVIVGVGNKAVGGPNEAVAAIRKSANSDQAVALRIIRDGHPAFVAIDLGQGGDNSSNG
jgi:serine protease Do